MKIDWRTTYYLYKEFSQRQGFHRFLSRKHSSWTRLLDSTIIVVSCCLPINCTSSCSSTQHQSSSSWLRRTTIMLVKYYYYYYIIISMRTASTRWSPPPTVHLSLLFCNYFKLLFIHLFIFLVWLNMKM